MATTRRRTLQIREYEHDPSLDEDKDQSSPSLPYQEYELQIEPDRQTKGEGTFPSVVVSTAAAKASSSSPHYWLRSPLRVFRDLFLPIGYPATVGRAYLRYQVYDSLQGLCSYLRGVVCSASVLQAAGVGNAEARAMSAAMTWALKDGLGMMGGLLFSYTASPFFDSHVKEFRLFADLINDVGLTLDMMAPWFPNGLLWISSLSTLCKVLCGMAAGATKASITVHFAVGGNMADLNAKEATQETLVSLLGMILGVTLAGYLSRLESDYDQPQLALHLQWTIFVALTVLHMWTNYRGVQLLHLETLNRERAEQVLMPLVQQMCMYPSAAALDIRKLHYMPEPEDVNESLLASTYKLLFPAPLRLDASLVEVLALLAVDDDDSDLTPLFDEFADERYVLAMESIPNESRSNVYISLLTNCTTRDELKAFCHALMIVERIRTKSLTAMVDDTTPAGRQKLIRETHRLVNLLFPKEHPSPDATICLFDVLVRYGWHVQDRLYLGFSRRRSQWSEQKVD